MFQSTNQQSKNSHEELTDEIYYEGLAHIHEYYDHLDNMSNYIPTSYPIEEPWFRGPPLFAYYTEIDFPVTDLDRYILTTDPDLPNAIYIPTKGPITSPLFTDIIAKIIGTNGNWLKKITRQTGAHYIWYNEKPNIDDVDTPPWGCFQIWGRQENLPFAVSLLKTHIKQVINNAEDYP